MKTYTKKLKEFLVNNVIETAPIDAVKASQFTHQFRVQEAIGLPRALEFHKDHLRHLVQLCENGDSVVVRFYLCMNDSDPENTLKLIAVAVDSDGDDILEVDGITAMYEFSNPCPPSCSKPNMVLNPEPIPLVTTPYTKLRNV